MPEGRLATYHFLVEYQIDGWSDESNHSDGQARLTVENTDKNRTLFEQDSAHTYSPLSSRLFVFSAKAQDGETFDGDQFEWCLKDLSVDSSGFFAVSWAATFESDHTHDPEPGVFEVFQDSKEYPENCDVLVNGASMGVDLGDGSSVVREVVDISDQLDAGINIIEVTSGSKGHVRATVQTELFRRGRTDG